MASRGTLGALLAGLSVWSLALKYGGDHHKGESDEDKKKGEDELKTAEISTRFGKMPEWASILLEHSPSQDLTLRIAGAMNKYEFTMKHLSKEKQKEVALDIAADQIASTLHKIPQAETFGVSEGVKKIVKTVEKIPERLVDGYTQGFSTKEAKENRAKDKKVEQAANSYTLDPEKIIDYRTNTPIKREQLDKYVDSRDKIIKEKLDYYKTNKVYVETPNGWQQKEFKSLSDEELSEVISEVRSYATKKVKFQLWGKDKTTNKEKAETEKRKNIRYKNQLGFSKH
jgi:hypothetical protein